MNDPEPQDGSREDAAVSSSGLYENPGARYLRRLEVFLDVVYALIFFRLLQYLPQVENMKWLGKPRGLLQLMMENHVELLRMLIGLVLVLIYWNLTNKVLGRLARTDTTHATLAMVQMVLVCLFLYFSIADPELAGGAWTMALQSASLAAAGFVGTWGWSYARKHQLVIVSLSKKDLDQVTRSSLTEPVTATLNTGLAWLGPLVWTAGWLVIPPIVSRFMKSRR